MSDRMVHVARDGRVLGIYPPEQIAGLLDSGHFLETDFCYSDTHREWTPLPEFLRAVDAPRYVRAREKSAAGAGGGRTHPARRSARSKKLEMAALMGWVSFLLAISALVAAGFWIALLQGDVRSGLAREAAFREVIADKDKEIQRLRFAASDVAEPGTVKGIITLRASSGRRHALTGLMVQLLPRKTVEQHLQTRADAAKSPSAGAPLPTVEYFLTGMPSPVKSTTTDASGRFVLDVPLESGEFVVYATARTGASRATWLVGFRAEDPVNSSLVLNEANAVTQPIPSLMIVEGR